MFKVHIRLDDLKHRLYRLGYTLRVSILAELQKDLIEELENHLDAGLRFSTDECLLLVLDQLAIRLPSSRASLGCVQNVELSAPPLASDKTT